MKVSKMRKFPQRLPMLSIFLSLIFSPAISWSLDTPTITIAAKGPNQINLTWSAVPNPGWGYKVEIQSNGDSRYSSWTDVTAILQNGFGYLPYWVTDGHYLDRTDGSGTVSGTCIAPSSTCGSQAQFAMFGLMYSTTYNFRVRTYGKTDAGVATYGAYSSTASATTRGANYAIRYVRTNGNDSNNGQTDSSGGAWATMAHASSVATNGMVILVHGGTYSGDAIITSNDGTYDGTNYDHKIVIMAYPGETPLIASSSSSNSIIYLNNAYWSIDGITFTDSGSNNNPATNITGSRNSYVNIVGTGPALNASALYPPNVPGSYNFIHNIYIGSWGVSNDGMGNGTYNISGNYNVQENSHITKIGHDTSYFGGNYNADLNDLLDGGWGMCVELQGSNSHHNLVEGCTCKDPAQDPSFIQYHVYKPDIEVSSASNTIRRNIFYNGSSHGFEISSLGGTSQYNLVYNNTIYGNFGAGIWYMVESTAEAYNYFYNNIVYDNTGDTTGSGFNSPMDVLMRGTYTGSLAQNNLILSASGASALDINIAGVANNLSVASANNTWATNFNGNVTTAPTFINNSPTDTNWEFHLQSTSYGIGGAIAVTDSTWGSVIGAGNDLGAFKYYAISGGVTVRPNPPSNLRIIQ